MRDFFMFTTGLGERRFLVRNYPKFEIRLNLGRLESDLEKFLRSEARRRGVEVELREHGSK